MKAMESTWYILSVTVKFMLQECPSPKLSFSNELLSLHSLPTVVTLAGSSNSAVAL